MKRIFLFLLSISVLTTASAMAKGTLNLSAFTGYSLSAFENQDSAAGTLPIGISASKSLTPQIDVGGELFFALGGYSFESDFFGETITTSINQHMIGAFGRYFVPLSSIKPFAKLGFGYYFGNTKVEGFGEEEEVDMDGAIGVNLGAGAMVTEHVFAEFNYNIVSRKSDGDSFGSNTWAILIGYTFCLGE